MVAGIESLVGSRQRGQMQSTMIHMQATPVIVQPPKCSSAANGHSGCVQLSQCQACLSCHRRRHYQVTRRQLSLKTFEMCPIHIDRELTSAKRAGGAALRCPAQRQPRDHAALQQVPLLGKLGTRSSTRDT
jgi:hypothetical protein